MRVSPEDRGTPHDILFVCTADRIRSPIAAAFLRSRLLQRAGRPSLRIESAGVDAVPGEPIDPRAAAIAEKSRLDLSGHRSKPVTAALLTTSRLVLTMTERQRANVLRLEPPMLARTFTLLEFLRLLDAGPVEAPREAGTRQLAMSAHAARPYTRRAAGAEDIPDPFGAPQRVYQTTVVRLLETASLLTDSLDALGVVRVEY